MEGEKNNQANKKTVLCKKCNELREGKFCNECGYSLEEKRNQDEGNISTIIDDTNVNKSDLQQKKKEIALIGNKPENGKVEFDNKNNNADVAELSDPNLSQDHKQEHKEQLPCKELNSNSNFVSGTCETSNFDNQSSANSNGSFDKEENAQFAYQNLSFGGKKVDIKSRSSSCTDNDAHINEKHSSNSSNKNAKCTIQLRSMSKNNSNADQENREKNNHADQENKDKTSYGGQANKDKNNCTEQVNKYKSIYAEQPKKGQQCARLVYWNLWKRFLDITDKVAFLIMFL